MPTTGELQVVAGKESDPEKKGYRSEYDKASEAASAGYYTCLLYTSILTEFSIASDQELASNYMAPVRSTTEVSFLPANKNRALFVPFDNDGFVRFGSYNFNSEETAESSTSYEVGALYNLSLIHI